MINREQWLLNAVDILREGIFKPRSVYIPELKLSVGLPHARNQRKIKIQYFPPDMSTDGTAAVFVSPLLADGSLIIGQLYNMLREIYAPVNHTLPTFTPAVSADFLQALGEYPDAALKLPDLSTQSTRMLKLECPHCGYILRATQRWISKGVPYCYCKPNAVFVVQRSNAEKNSDTGQTEKPVPAETADDLPF